LRASPAERCPRRLSLQAGGGREGGRSACWAHPLVEPGQRVSDPILVRVTGWAEPLEAEPAGGRRQGRQLVGVLAPVIGEAARQACARLRFTFQLGQRLG
jgi:hypothetical protein